MDSNACLVTRRSSYSRNIDCVSNRCNKCCRILSQYTSSLLEYSLARNGEGNVAIYKDALLPGIGDGSMIQRSHVVTS